MLGYNGTVNGFFKGKRGLRQGDPLSPYLFVIAMNVLSHMLNRAAAQSRIKLHSNCHSMKLTHLSFADDLLIFIDGSIESVQQVLQVLKEFEMRSGLAVSMQKTSFLASGLTCEEVETIQASTGMSLGHLPFRYLGVPLDSRKITLANCEPLIQQVKARFNNWSVKSLSFAARLLLIKTVISGITNFWCSAFILPKACIARINSLCSIFLWKGNLEGHNSARVSWGTVVLTKRQGGLGVKDLNTWNKACCLRLIWLLFFRHDSVCASWFKEVILKRSVNTYWTTTPKQSYSWFTNKLLKLKDTVFPLIKLRLENGITARFWFDNWTPFGCLYDHLRASQTRLGIPLNATVSSLYYGGAWHLPSARTDRQLELLCFLTTVQLTTNEDYYDWIVEGRTSTKFRTGEIYAYLSDDRQDVQWHSAVWTKRGIPRHNFHAWLVVLDRLPTRDRLIRWGIQVDHQCLLCNSYPETRDHIFGNCNFYRQLWSLVARRIPIAPRENWMQTLDQMISLPPPTSSRILTLLAWQATLYWIWNERNSRLHANLFRPVDSLFKQIDGQVRNKIQSIRESSPILSSQMIQQWFTHQ